MTLYFIKQFCCGIHKLLIINFNYTNYYFEKKKKNEHVKLTVNKQINNINF